jgi:hypothetical protein
MGGRKLARYVLEAVVGRLPDLIRLVTGNKKGRPKPPSSRISFVLGTGSTPNLQILR